MKWILFIVRIENIQNELVILHKFHEIQHNEIASVKNINVIY